MSVLIYKGGKIFFYICNVTIIMLFLMVIRNEAFSQKTKIKHLPDTVHLNKGNLLFIGKKIIKAENDTLIIFRKKTRYKIRIESEYKSEIFYDSLKTKASRNKFTNELYNLLITRNQTDSARVSSNTLNSDLEYADYENKIIRNIIIKRMDPFGTSVIDTSMIAESWIEKSLNAIHIKSFENVISGNIFIRKGDSVNPYILAENERILRNLPYMYDARIYASIIDANNIDIYIITRDLWSIGLITDLGSRAGNIEVYDLNYLGLGNSLKNQLFYDKDSSQHFGYRFEYDLNNIKRTFIDAGVFYHNVYEIEQFGLFGSRSFLTSKSKYAGGVYLTKTNEISYISSSTYQNLQIPVKYFTSDIWMGKSFILKKDKKNVNSLRLILSAGYLRKHFSERMLVDKFTYKLYHHSDLILGSISLSKRNYYKGNLIYAFGIVEDIPHGYLIEATLGPEKREFSNRFYYGFKISAGDFIKDFGYLYASLEIGGYKNGHFSEQDVIRINVNSFSNLFFYKKYKFRNFINLNYVIGFNRFEGEYIKLDFLAPEMQSNLMLGTQKLSLKLENVAFTPVDFYGFKVAMYGFWDLGILGSNKHFILSEKYFLGLGAGLRIRNDNLVFQTFQLNVAYYPILPSGGQGFVFGISGQNVLKLFDFISNKPKEVDFN